MTALVIRSDAAHLPLPDNSVDLVVTSPPYFALRSYQDGGQHYAKQIGSEATPQEFLEALWTCTAEWMRVLKPSGSIFVNLGDKYSGAQAQNIGGANRAGDSARTWAQTNPKNKSLMLLPERYRIGCVDRLGLIARSVIIWDKPNGLPESVTDRVRRSHEDWVHLTKLPRCFSAIDEIREPHAGTSPPRPLGVSNKTQRHEAATDNTGWKTHPVAQSSLGKLPGSVWTVATEPLNVPDHLGVDHFAAFPTEWPRRIIQGWSPAGICTACDEGRRPVSVVDLGVKERDTPAYTDIGINGSGRHGKGASTLGSRGTSATITGYACACPTPDAHTRPATVLDPFGGTGTTALCASVLGRIGISVDLSHDYSRLAQWRTQDPASRAKAMRVEKPPVQLDGQIDMFGGAA